MGVNAPIVTPVVSTESVEALLFRGCNLSATIDDVNPAVAQLRGLIRRRHQQISLADSDRLQSIRRDAELRFQIRGNRS